MATPLATMMTSALLLACLVGAGRADEAVLPDGRRLQGTLTVDAAGKAHFAPADKAEPIALAALHAVRFPPAEVQPFHLGTPLRVLLPGGQHVTGELQALDAESLRLRTTWAERVIIPRRQMMAVRHPPGLLTLFSEGFEQELKGWELTGKPARNEQQAAAGRFSLLLNEAGQGASYTLPTPLVAGRLGVSFRAGENTAGGRWVVEAEFAAAPGKRLVTVVVAGDGDAYAVDAPLPAGESCRLTRSPGWHRLGLRFQPEYLLVGVDGHLLWECGKEGPGGPLRRVRLACVGTQPRAEVFFDELSLARQVDEPVRVAADPARDEVRLPGGDQLFGDVLRADPGGVELRGRFGPRRLPWGEVLGVYLKPAAPPSATPRQEQVRVWLQTGLGGEEDQLEGVLRSLDARRLVLRHPVLGDVDVERGRLRRLAPASARP